MDQRATRLLLPLLAGLLTLACFTDVSFAQGDNPRPTRRRAPLMGDLMPLPAEPSRTILVRFRPGKSLSGIERIQVRAGQKSFNRTVARTAEPTLPPMELQREISKLGIFVYRLPNWHQMKTTLAQLRKMPEVLYAEPSQRITLLSPPNDTYYNLLENRSDKVLFPPNAWPFQWGLPIIQAEAAWSVWPGKFYTAADKPHNSVRVAVIDTGVDLDHPDFINAGGSDTDSLFGGQLDLTNSRSIVQGVVDTFPYDDYGHGTHVAGIVGAATNNGEGIASIGYNAQIMVLKVTEPAGDGDDADVIDAMVWAADHGALILNLSLALNGGFSQALQDAVDYCWSKNTLVVAAAGNDGNDFVRRYPGACNKVLAVAATTYFSDGTGASPNITIPPYENSASYSNSGLYIGIAAPGGDATYWLGNEDLFGLPLPEINTLIWSTTPTYDTPLTFGGTTEYTYGYLQGTSMASPHVAGLAALYAGAKGITQATPDAPRKIMRAIQRGADNLAGRADGGWTSVVGFGRINALATLQDQFGLGRPLNTPGCITGQVSYGGVAVTPAAVTATNLTSRRRYGASTKEDGTYRIANVPAGNYSVKASFLGTTRTLSSVAVEAGCDAMATDFELKNPVTVTITPHVVTVPAGATQPFSATVTGNPSVAVIWSVVTGPGTIDAVGNYTAPTNGPSPATAIVRATSVADPTAFDDAQITIPIYPGGLTLTPGTVVGGASTTGKVTISGISATPTVVSLSSNHAAITVPASVTVPAGSTTANFNITTVAVRANTSGVITATTGGKSKTATLTVQTVMPISVSVSPNPVTGGGSAVGTVTLNANAPVGGLSVTLRSNNTAVATVPASVTVPAGSKTATFNIATSAVAVQTSVSISGTAKGVSPASTLVVKP